MNLFKPIIEHGQPTVWIAILIIGLALISGLGFALVYCFVKRRDGYYRDIPMTYVFFPLIVTTLTIAIFLIPIQFSGTTTEVRFARVGVAVIAAFTVLRFRTIQRTTEDLTYLLLLVGVSILLALGYVWFGLLLLVLAIALLLILHFVGFPAMGKRNLNLRITIPEDLNYDDAFTDILEEYTIFNNLTKVKTADLGTMFTLNYEVVLKKGVSSKEFMDKLRTRNGNLNIVLTVKKFSYIDEN